MFVSALTSFIAIERPDLSEGLSLSSAAIEHGQHFASLRELLPTGALAPLRLAGCIESTGSSLVHVPDYLLAAACQERLLRRPCHFDNPHSPALCGSLRLPAAP